MIAKPFLAAALATVLGGLVLTADQSKPKVPPRTAADDGFTDTPMLPNLPWHVHDPARPNPPIVTPGNDPGAAPSDARILFNGKDLSQWAHRDRDKVLEPTWRVRRGYFETGKGSLHTRESFGDVQLHLEWAAPSSVAGNSQGRGNSGIYLMGQYEIQVLDSYNNRTYADGQAAAMYGQWPPLVNAARPPGEWQTYDIVFEAPRFENGKLVKPAFQTVIWNGVIVHNRKEVMGSTIYRNVAQYKPHAPELPLMIQDHANPVRFRNIWIRKLGEYDRPGQP